MSVNEIHEVISLVTSALDQAGIEYAITGSVASSLHGEPVTTQDVDIVLRMTVAQAKSLAGSLPQRFYRNSDSILEIAQKGGMANLIDMETTFKVDLSVVALDAFHSSVFQRKQTLSFEVGGPDFNIVSPEDIILMKLHWRKDSQSTKQWADALGVARIRGARMDWKYLFEQAKSLGLEQDLIKLRDEAGI